VKTIAVGDELHERLNKYRKSDRGSVPFHEAISTLLDFWDDKHK
jgi:hypothetical protein